MIYPCGVGYPRTTSTAWQLMYQITHKPPQQGHFYWFSHKYERIWRMCYCMADPDDDLWITILGIKENWKVSNLDIDMFDWVEVYPPKGIK